MLAEEDSGKFKYVESHGTVTVQELTDLLNTSESTVRRSDRTSQAMGSYQVHGGATTVGTSVRTRDEELSGQTRPEYRKKNIKSQYMRLN